MTKDITKAVALLRKSYEMPLTPEEQEEVNCLLANEKIRQIYEKAGDDESLILEFRRYGQWPVTRGLENFKKKQRKVKNLRLFKRLSVAACFLIALGGIWMLYSRPGSEPVMQNTLAEVGSGVSQLRLADGRLVAIGQDEKDVITEIDGMTIRLENGKVAYEKNGEEKSEETSVKYNELFVPRGGECYLVLDDGTKVWMNADSHLKYPVRFSSTRREVQIEGEGYFEVVPDGRPFVVTTSLGKVKVLGTSFGVRAYPEESVLTTLASGKVVFANMVGTELELEPGEQAQAKADGTLAKHKVETDEYISWRNGWFVFREEPLENVMEMLGRWYDVTVFFQSQSLKERHFTGNLKRYDSIQTFLEVLAGGGQVKYKIEGKTVILYD